jgi:hypothetical protein
MTKHQREKYNWQFIYLGADQDAMAEGQKFGVEVRTAATYSKSNFAGAMFAASGKMAAYRAVGASADALDFTDEDREALG